MLTSLANSRNQCGHLVHADRADHKWAAIYPGSPPSPPSPPLCPGPIPTAAITIQLQEHISHTGQNAPLFTRGNLLQYLS